MTPRPRKHSTPEGKGTHDFGPGKRWLDDLRKGATKKQLHAIDRLLKRGFIVVVHNPTNKPDSRYEAWGYQGNLDFNTAAPVRFGLGSDPFEAMHALNHHLFETTKDNTD